MATATTTVVTGAGAGASATTANEEMPPPPYFSPSNTGALSSTSSLPEKDAEPTPKELESTQKGPEPTSKESESLDDNQAQELPPPPYTISARASTSTSIPSPPPPPLILPASLSALSTFHPAKSRSFLIAATGIPLIRLPFLNPSQLETHVLNTADGTVAYTSKRESVKSGNCVLLNAEGKEVVGTQYFWGPGAGKEPILKRMMSEGGSDEGQEVEGEEESIKQKTKEQEGVVIKAEGKWTSRMQKFSLPSGGVVEWKYEREKGSDGTKDTVLVLEEVGDGKQARRRIAQLVRNEETRTPGSRSSTAGNGGLLIVDADAMSSGCDEPLIVATCLLMLKKEIDRRRMMQFAAFFTMTPLVI